VAEIRIPIPPGAELVQPYPVHLPDFDGPLDLLLHLIKKNEVDLRNLPVAEICRQYHEYLMLMQELDLEVAAEFLYVESLLVHIKSQMVLPRTQLEGGPQEDPREELVRRLLEYRRYKAVAETLHEMEAQRLGMWARPTMKPDKPEAVADGEEGAEGAAAAEPAEPDQTQDETDLSEVSLFDLLGFFRNVLERYKAAHPRALENEHPRYNIKEKMEEMLSLVRGGSGTAALAEVFHSLSGRAEVIATFLAVLELLRLGMVRAVQAEEFGEIYLNATGEEQSLENYEEAYR
jgi:segregation and condensation protein A